MNVCHNHGAIVQKYDGPRCPLCAPEPMTGIDATLAERGARYGDFTDHAVIAQNIQDAMRRSAGWDHLDAVKKQALTVIADKIARVLSGDPDYRDNWHDMQGYAKLAEDRCAVAPAPPVFSPDHGFVPAAVVAGPFGENLND